MLEDQESTRRLEKPQSGSCLHCHASVLPLYRQLGGGDLMAGFESSFKLSYAEMNQKLHQSGHADPVSCIDCHDPRTCACASPGRAFCVAFALAESNAEVPAIPSIALWRSGARRKPYDPNVDASRNELRSFVCGQCHVEYYCSGKMPLTFPWGRGLRVDDIEAYWDETKFPDGESFYDYKHAETGAAVLKAQHPEFELWSQGIHARSGVSCADCHMPYAREGATKSATTGCSPLLNINRACQTCHRASEGEMRSRVELIRSATMGCCSAAGSPSSI